MKSFLGRFFFPAVLIVSVLVSSLGLSSATTINAYSWALGDLGHPRSSFSLGSARHLDGKNVIVSLFGESLKQKWTEDEKERMLKDLTIACDYIEDAAKEYDRNVEMIYDWNEEGCEDLLYSGFVHWDINKTPMGKQEAMLDERIATWLKIRVDYEALMEKYDADGIFMIVYLNTGGRPYAISYDGEDNPQESLIMYPGREPATFAHEILHLFGAHDFYEGAEYTEDAVKYIEKKYPNDIMLRTDSGNEIPNTVGELTAYHLGWLERSEDVEEYPQLSRYEIK